MQKTTVMGANIYIILLRMIDSLLALRD